jgi:hypothetical protein
VTYLLDPNAISDRWIGLKPPTHQTKASEEREEQSLNTKLPEIPFSEVVQPLQPLPKFLPIGRPLMSTNLRNRVQILE